MITIQQALKEGQTLFTTSSSPALDAELLLAHILKCARTTLHAWPGRTLTETEKQAYQSLCAQHAEGKPVAYLLGQQAFWKLNLQVTPEVLIPRPETELLVETALNLINKAEANVVDLGTGSGAVALALAYERSQWQITAVDESAAALQIAKANTERLNVQNIKFLESNWFENLSNKKFHLIVSNPPYIALDDPHLLALKYEPATALIAENQGLADLESIIQKAPQHLLPQGYLILEHGYQQAEQVQNLMQKNGFKHIITEQDLAGHPRVTWGKRC